MESIVQDAQGPAVDSDDWLWIVAVILNVGLGVRGMRPGLIEVGGTRGSNVNR